MIARELLPVLHLVAALLASWRLTDIVLHERIAEPLRRHGGYLMTCPACLSVWAGGMALLGYLWCPWAAWPFAMSWAYLYWLGRRQRPMNLEQRLATVEAMLRRARAADEIRS